MELESAIPPNLLTERRLPSNLQPKYQPPFPAYVARWPETVKGLVMAILGAQHQSKPSDDACAQKLISFVESGTSTSSPKYWELAAYTDNQNYYNEAVFAYWPSQVDFEIWASSSGFGAWWASLDAASQSNGWFKEVLYPAIDRFETIFSSNAASEGAAHMKQDVSGPVAEHVYWGSMRDRLPASQHDKMVGAPWPRIDSPVEQRTGGSTTTKGNRVRVPGHTNLAVIRSGQDWSDTLPNERKLYLETMHPVLVKGMDFLRDQGGEVGCISNRFMHVVQSKAPAHSSDKTFGLGYFDDLASLEKWSKQHKTHLDIFGGFLKYAKELQNEISLRLFHEVLVLEEDQQVFEYVNCHERTGMLRTLS